jgi:hypothetical protein
MVSLLVSTFITEAQKSGILQKDHYGAFTGNDWEDFLANKRAADFEKKSNVTLASYLEVLGRFTKEHLKEGSISSTVMNSTVVSFPEGSDVYTADADGNWKTRSAYPGEKGFMHTKTKICWLSFSCGNLVKTIFGNPAPPVQPGTTDPALMVKYTPPGNTNTTTINVTPNNNWNNNGDEQELSYRKGIKIFAEGANFYADVQRETVSLLRQNPLGCCNGGANTTPVQQISYANPSLVAQAVPGQSSTQTIIYKSEDQKVGFGQSFGGNVLANFIGGTAANVVGTYAVRGIDALTRRRVVYTTTPAPVYQNTFPPVYGTTPVGGFYGNNQVGYNSNGTSSVSPSATTSVFATGGTTYNNGNWVNNPTASNIIGQR